MIIGAIIGTMCIDCFGDEWTKIETTFDMGGRDGHTAVYIENYHLMVVFGDWGGWDNNVWILDLNQTPAQWKSYEVKGSSPTARGGHTAVYDRTEQRMIVFGGAYHPGGQEEKSFVDADTYVLSGFGSGELEWERFSAVGIECPSPRIGHSAIYDEDTKSMIIFGGEIEFDPPESNNEVYKLDFSYDLPQWSRLQPDGKTPPPKSHHQAIWKDDTREMIVYGGWGGGPDESIMFALDFSGDTPTWRKLDVGGDLPSEHGRTAAIYHKTERFNRIIVFGGREREFQTNNTYIIDLTLGKAVETGNIGYVPSEREGHTAVYDTKEERMIVFGGWSEEEQMDDTVYAFSLTGVYAGSSDNTETWNYPNPFNPTKEQTIIRYYLKNDTNVEIRIFTLTGELVYSKRGIDSTEGFNIWHWDGRNGEGRIVENGGYICFINAGGEQHKCKIAVLK